jgi:hypothetical protein
MDGAWRDDVQVIALVAERVWCERAFTMVTASVAAVQRHAEVAA